MLPLNPGESVVKQSNVLRQNPQGPRPGLLTLTNHRLVFEVHLPPGPGGPAGPGGPGVRATIDAPLGRIRNVSTPGPSRFQVELPMQIGVFETPEAAAWVQAITEARSHAPAGPGGGPGPRAGPGGPGGPGRLGGPGPPPPPPPPPRACQYCGLANRPASGKCPQCGAPG